MTHDFFRKPDASFCVIIDVDNDDGKRDQDVNGVCVDEVCRSIGCPKILDSVIQVDECGVCGGNGTNCVAMNGSVHESIVKARALSYTLVTTVPAKSRNIRIFEMGKSRNYIAATILKEANNSTLESPLINWDFKIRSNGRYKVENLVTLDFYREDDLLSRDQYYKPNLSVIQLP